mmetsp:Transcript_9499/g.14669  ORF Transcript_9499/g.14669 Transcript_9499/m.14669 type:complete len:275 (-) Transcript_9499:523-1347(-)
MMQLLLSFAFFLLNFTSGFIISPHGQNFRTTTTTTQLQAAKKNQVTLTLGASVNTESSSLPYKAENINAFLQDNWGLLISAGGKRPWEPITEVTDELRQQWIQQCEILGITPATDFTLVSVTTGGISFPGLTLTSLAKIGVQQKNKEDDTDITYEFGLLGDTREVKGLPPVVWIYKKLTGDDDDKSDSGGGNTGQKSLTSVTYRINDDDTVTFRTETFLEIAVSFPSLLMKILPTSKEKAEKQGRNAIQKVLDKDVSAAMDAFEEAYRAFATNA